jgi:hypothetical protein
MKQSNKENDKNESLHQKKVLPNKTMAAYFGSHWLSGWRLNSCMAVSLS